jgi:hypothetical protein
MIRVLKSWIATAAVAATFSLGCAGVFAQDRTPTDSRPSTDSRPTVESNTRRDDDGGFNYGWLGLAGLIGLAGLLPRGRAVENFTVRDGAGNVKQSVRS